MRRVVLDMQNYLFADAIAKTLRDYDFDFLTEMSQSPEKTEELCRLVQANILIMEVRECELWRLEDRMKTCQSVKKAVPNCKIVMCVDEKRYKEVAASVVKYKKIGLIDNFIFTTISASYLSALLDAL